MSVAMRPPGPTAAERRQQHWRRTRGCTLWLTLAWFGVTFGTIFFARELSAIVIFGWPLSFYLAAQGATLVYLALIAGYAWQMARLDRLLKSNEADGADGGNGQ